MHFSLLSDLLANLATFLGIPLAIILFMNEKQKERHEREYETYNSLDDKYLDFMKLLIDNPDIDFFQLTNKDIEEYQTEKRIRLISLFEYFISLLERSFLLYSDRDSEMKKLQWSGWVKYIEDCASKQGFQTMWKELGRGYYDERFCQFLETILEKKMIEKEN